MSTTTPTPSAEATQPLPVCGRRTVLRAVGLVALGRRNHSDPRGLRCRHQHLHAVEHPGRRRHVAARDESERSREPERASASETEQSDAEPEGTKVATSDVPVGGGVIIEEKYVVTQPAEGEFKVFSAICTHQQNPVGEVTDKQIICPFHQSHFSITDGSVISGPAQTALPAIAFTTSGDNIVITA